MFTRDSMTGKHALVCGGSKGIGFACAEQLAQAGARVTLLARRQEELDKSLRNLERFGTGHRAIACDLSHSEQLQALLLKMDLAVDILICNSGGPTPGQLLDADTQALEQAFRQHVLAPQALAQAFVPHMKTQNFGRIINIISTSVKIPLPNLGVSNTVRGAVASWSKTLASELGPFGITVNNILPGFTKTERLEQIVANSCKKSGQGRAEVEASMLKDVPARRFAEPEDPAFACLFLASAAAGYINGINLPVDGGRTGCL